MDSISPKSQSRRPTDRPTATYLGAWIMHTVLCRSRNFFSLLHLCHLPLRSPMCVCVRARPLFIHATCGLAPLHARRVCMHAHMRGCVCVPLEGSSGKRGGLNLINRSAFPTTTFPSFFLSFFLSIWEGTKAESIYERVFPPLSRSIRVCLPRRDSQRSLSLSLSLFLSLSLSPCWHKHQRWFLVHHHHVLSEWEISAKGEKTALSIVWFIRAKVLVCWCLIKNRRMNERGAHNYGEEIFCAFLSGLGFSLFEKIQRGEDHLRDNLRLWNASWGCVAHNLFTSPKHAKTTLLLPALAKKVLPTHFVVYALLFSFRKQCCLPALAAMQNWVSCSGIASGSVRSSVINDLVRYCVPLPRSH